MNQQHKTAMQHLCVRIDPDTFSSISGLAKDLNVERSLLVRAILAQFIRMVSDKDGNPRADVVTACMFSSLGQKLRS